jgi:hypothetical protein
LLSCQHIFLIINILTIVWTSIQKNTLLSSEKKQRMRQNGKYCIFNALEWSELHGREQAPALPMGCRGRQPLPNEFFLTITEDYEDISSENYRWLRRHFF